MKILVVDDEPSVREILSLVLRHSGHEVILAGDGTEALALFQQRGADLVITDRKMPEMDGERLAAAIRRLDPATPIVLVSGQCDGVRFPFDATLPKPFTPKTLMAAVDQALQRRAHSLEHRLAA